MKLLHLSDLHLGLKVCEMSMLDEQREIFEQIFTYLSKYPVDAVLLAGDIYDKSVPPVDAILLFDEILGKFSDMGLPVLMISGNHDSAERLSFGARVMKKNMIWIGTNVSEAITPIKLYDRFGPVNFYLLPFIRPIDVNNAFGQTLTKYTDALRYVIEQMQVNTDERNVILSHQFVADTSTFDSERTVGNTDCVDKCVYEIFDYTALGHLHAPKSAGNEKIRYCGTPLKYSLSEIEHKKSMTIVTLSEKSNVQIETVPLFPKHDMRKITGTFQQLTSVAQGSEDYIYAELTNENDVSFAATGLRQVYPNLISVSYRRKNDAAGTDALSVANAQEEKTPEEIFIDLFLQQHPDTQLTELQQSVLKKVIEKVWGAFNS